MANVDSAPGGLRKSIVLFSDGTGNSSSKLQKTNVWRLYEALDLGYPANNTAVSAVTAGAANAHEEVQLAYYDDGVGTSAFKLLAILGGVFGFGLSRNIRDLYKFLCRNYDPDANDRIYAFGFSRGAYTIRLVVSLISTMGVVPYHDEAQLDRDARDMWREYRRYFHTNNRLTDLMVGLGRAIMRGFIRLGRLPSGAGYAKCVPAPLRRKSFMSDWTNYWYSKSAHDVDRADTPGCGPEIEFVGVWDTVAAYGGPIVEITRAIDEWIWPLSMPNYRLSEKVKCARHALAIDDKRDSFQPLLWDEPNERKLDCWNPQNPRLQQVWFAGMHSDVGGGYSDESLSYVSLWWMIEHAELAGLRLLSEHRSKIDSLRNIYGPIHNSRGGGGAFYRYQPRYINAWIDYDGTLDGGQSVRPATQIYRDPTIDRDPHSGKGRYTTRGLLAAPVRIHISVEERLKKSTDGYGPNNLPPHYQVDDGVRPSPPIQARNPVSKDLVIELGDRIKIRRFWYFLSMLVVAVLLVRPYWQNIPLLDRFGGSVDARTDAQLVEQAFNFFLPEFAQKWTHALAADPYRTFALIAALLGFTALGVRNEWSMVDVSRKLWGHRFADRGAPEPVRGKRNPAVRFCFGLFHLIRSSDGVQAFLGWWKWRAVPWFLGLVLWLGLIYLGAAAITQLWLVWGEQRPELCELNTSVKAKPGMPIIVDIASPCSDLGQRINWSEAGQTYTITVEMLDGSERPGKWLDERNPATPLGWNKPESVALLDSAIVKYLKGWTPDWFTNAIARSPHDLSELFQRVVSAQLFQPVIEIREKDPDQSAIGRLFVGDSIYMLVPDLERVGVTNSYAATFTVPPHKHGQFHFFLNDAVLPIDPGVAPGVNCAAPDGHGLKVFKIKGRYGNNCGKARVTLIRIK